MHSRRLITGFLTLPLFLVCIFWEYGDWFSAFIAVIAFFIARAEMYSLMGVKHRRLLLWWQNLLALAFFIFTVLHDINVLVTLSFLFFWGSCLISIHKKVEGSRYEIATHGLSLIYLLFPLACFIYLRSIENGPFYLFFMLAVSCFTDIGAYYGGKKFGKRKLALIISPHKTVEGSICGAMLAAVVVLITSFIQGIYFGNTLWLPGAHRYVNILIVTIIMSVIGQVGDLCESAMKRDAHVKDSGSDITGHGGFLDMMDSMLWIGPAMFVYAMLFS